MATEKIEAVVFDWGGVLMDDPLPTLLNYCSERLDVTADALNGVYGKYLPQFQTGALTEAIFWEHIAQDLGVATPQPPTLWGEGFKKTYSPREGVFAQAARLQKAGLPTAMLSNTEQPVAQFFRAQGYTMFDHVVLSCEEGTRKPERRIFELLLERVRTAPEAILYLDDIEEYVKAGRALGITAYPVQTEEEIAHVLGRHNLPIG